MNLSGTVYHPGIGQYVNYQAIPLSEDPDLQVAQTIELMRRNVIEDSQHPAIQEQAAAIQQQGSGDPVSDVFDFVRGRVGFQRDEVIAEPMRSAAMLNGEVVEVLIRPRDLATMDRPIEDCDGFASYGPALLKAMGIPCAFVTVAADNRDPGRFSHVYAACYPPGGERVSIDSSHGPYAGWEAPDQYNKVKEWPIDGPNWCELAAIALALTGLWLLAGAIR